MTRADVHAELRQWITFALGGAGIINEIFIRDGMERPWLLGLLGMLMGAPGIAAIVGLAEGRQPPKPPAERRPPGE